MEIETSETRISRDSNPQTPSTLQSNKPMLNDVPPKMTTMMTRRTTATTTRMAPRSTGLSASIAAADADKSTTLNSAAAVAVAREDEPLLYNIPDGVHATYRPLPWLVQLGTILVAAFLSGITTWKRSITWMHPIVALQSRKVNVLAIVKFLVKVRTMVLGDLEKEYFMII
jgi:hypothetical protein